LPKTVVSVRFRLYRTACRARRAFYKTFFLSAIYRILALRKAAGTMIANDFAGTGNETQ
jgi:hypothetical protein